MTNFILQRRSGILLMLIIMVSSVRSANAQSMAESADHEWHFRYEFFQMLLEQRGLRPVDSPQVAIDNPKRSVIVMIGRLDGVLQPRLIEQFCEAGGSVLMASDAVYSAGRIGEFNAGSSHTESRRAADHYQGHADCLLITDLDGSHPMTKGVSSLVVNRTGWLEIPRSFRRDWVVTARLPGNLRPSTAGRQPLLAFLEMPADNRGKLLLAADPSLFTNGMLWHGDNAILAINVSLLLAEDNRDQVLFVVNGQILGSYREGLPSDFPPNDLPIPENLPEPETQTMLRFANLVVENVNKSNLLNEVIANRPRNMPERFYRRAVLFALAIAALLFIMWKLAAGGPTTHPAMPGRDMKSAHALSTGQKVRTAEFGLSASLLARDLCRELTGATDPAEWQRKLGQNAASGELAVKTNSNQDQLTMVLDLAVNTRTVHISRRRFEHIGRTIQELRDLHQGTQLLN